MPQKHDYNSVRNAKILVASDVIRHAFVTELWVVLYKRVYLYACVVCNEKDALNRILKEPCASVPVLQQGTSSHYIWRSYQDQSNKSVVAASVHHCQ